VSYALGQSAMPTNSLLSRVFIVESDFDRGTIFALDIDGREYWLTAKHIFTGKKELPAGSLSDRTVTVRILNPNASTEIWLPLKFRTLDPGKDIDIVVLAPDHSVLPALGEIDTSSGGEMLGGECSFVGFPRGGGWIANLPGGQRSWMPFTKHCTISALTSDGNAIWTLDGINNPGFSGAPVAYKTGDDQKIFAVVSGYRTEPVEVVSTGTIVSTPPEKHRKSKDATQEEEEQPSSFVNVNSGFIIAFDIQSAIDIIKSHPIGPLSSPAKQPAH
jgi:hypothetical protein